MRILRQQDVMDCGLACLLTISRHYKKNPDYDELRTLCNLWKSGVSLLGISKAAEKIGFKTVGGRLSLKRVLSYKSV